MGRSPGLPSKLAVFQEELALIASLGQQQGRDDSTAFRHRPSLKLREYKPGESCSQRPQSHKAAGGTAALFLEQRTGMSMTGPGPVVKEDNGACQPWWHQSHVGLSEKPISEPSYWETETLKAWSGSGEATF